MTKEQLIYYKNILIKELNSIDATLITDEIPIEGDEIDHVQSNLIISMQEMFSKRNEYKFNQIKNALIKIENGSYGICLECEEEISMKRLDFNPSIELCVSCKEKLERNKL